MTITRISLLSLTILLFVQLRNTSAACDACFYRSCFKKVIVIEHFNQTGQMAIDRTNDILYFLLKDGQKFHNLAFDLNNIVLHKIEDINFAFARAVDQNTRDLYLSDHENVYKSNPGEDFTYDMDLLFSNTVWHMQFKDKLYYTLFNQHGLKYYENGTHKEIEELQGLEINDFIIDNKNDIYFNSEFSLYVLKHGEKVYREISDDIYTLTADKDGIAHILQPYSRAIYKYDDKKHQLISIGAIASGIPNKAVFTSENYMIYSDVAYHGIYVLVPSTGSCKISTKGAGREAKKSVERLANSDQNIVNSEENIVNSEQNLVNSGKKMVNSDHILANTE